MKASCLSQKPVLFMGFLLLEADIDFELWILDDLDQSRGYLRVQHLKICENLFHILITRLLAHPKSQPSPLPLIQNIPSDGKSEHTWGRCFESCFPQQKWWWITEPVQLQFRHLLSLLSDHVVLRNINRMFRSRSQGLDANIGNGIVPYFLSVFTCQACFYLRISRSCFSISWHVVRWNSRNISRWIKRRKQVSKNVFLHSGLLPMYEAAIFCRGWTTQQNSESFQVDWERETIFHKILTSISWISPEQFVDFICSCIRCNWEVSHDFLSIFPSRTHQLVVLALSSFFQCVLRICVPRRTFSFRKHFLLQWSLFSTRFNKFVLNVL